LFETGGKIEELRDIVLSGLAAGCGGTYAEDNKPEER
jgi:hypothetical protein